MRTIKNDQVVVCGEDEEALFARTLRLMHRYLEEASAGYQALADLAARYGILDGVIDARQATLKQLAHEVRQLMATLSLEATCILVQAMMLAGDPMLAEVCGIALERPREEVGH